MRALVSFHAVDVEFFDKLIDPLVAGEKINPEAYLGAALHLRATEWRVQGYREALEFLLEQIEPPAPPDDGTLWEKVRTRLERFDHKPPPVVRMVAAKVDADLHIHGRPFLITEGSADGVAQLVDEFRKATSDSAAETLILEQLVRLDPKLGPEIRPEQIPELSPDGAYRSELLNLFKEIYDLGHGSREDLNWKSSGRSCREIIEAELPWRAAWLYSRVSPFWIARDVDGLDTVARAARIPPADFLVPGRRLFAAAIEAYPGLRDTLGVELGGPQSVGAYVSPGDVGALLDYLNAHGSRIIQVATRHGEGAACTTLLRKIRECATYAARRKLGYLEASGILPLLHKADDED